MDPSSFNSTWSETIKAVEYSKKNLPWEASQLVPIKRASLHERKNQEREYDPITTQYRDEAKESMIKTMRADQQNEKLLATTDRLQQQFNIVSHQGPPRRLDNLIKNPRQTSTRDFNFVTNMRHTDHKSTPLLYDEVYNIEKIKSRHEENRPATVHVKVRDFNMISNDYYENKVQRKHQEDSALKETLTKKFWDTHSYDPVKVRYYDDNKEELFQQQRQTLTEVQGIATQLKLPPSVQYSDGNSYNILNHNVYDDQRLKATRVMEDRSLNRIKRRGIEEQMRETGGIAAETADIKKLNKVNYKRWEGQLDRGYNMMNNSVVVDAPSPLPSRPPTMWSRLNTTPAHYQDSGVRASTGNMGDLRQELVPSGRSRNLSGAGPVGGPAFPSSGGSRGMEGYASFLDSAAEVPGPSSRSNQFSERSALNSRYSGGESARDSGRDSGRNNVRASTSIPATRNNNFNFNDGKMGGTQPNSRGGGGVPSLDLARTEFAEKITYQEPLNGAKGLAVPMVRTGGMSSYRKD